MEEDRKLKLFAVHSYISLLQREPEKLPQRFLQVISWVSLQTTTVNLLLLFLQMYRHPPQHSFLCFPSLQVLGEYCYLEEDLEPSTVLRLMANLLDLKTTSSETKTWVLLAMTKLCEGSSSVTEEVCETYSSSLDTVLRQRAQELQHLSQDSELKARVLPRDASRDPLEVKTNNIFSVINACVEN